MLTLAQQVLAKPFLLQQAAPALSKLVSGAPWRSALHTSAPAHAVIEVQTDAEFRATLDKLAGERATRNGVPEVPWCRQAQCRPSLTLAWRTCAPACADNQGLAIVDFTAKVRHAACAGRDREGAHLRRPPPLLHHWPCRIPACLFACSGAGHVSAGPRSSIRSSTAATPVASSGAASSPGAVPQGLTRLPCMELNDLCCAGKFIAPHYESMSVDYPQVRPGPRHGAAFFGLSTQSAVPQARRAMLSLSIAAAWGAPDALCLRLHPVRLCLQVKFLKIDIDNHGLQATVNDHGITGVVRRRSASSAAASRFDRCAREQTTSHHQLSPAAATAAHACCWCGGADARSRPSPCTGAAAAWRASLARAWTTSAPSSPSTPRPPPRPPMPRPPRPPREEETPHRAAANVAEAAARLWRSAVKSAAHGAKWTEACLPVAPRTRRFWQCVSAGECRALPELAVRHELLF